MAIINMEYAVVNPDMPTSTVSQPSQIFIPAAGDTTPGIVTLDYINAVVLNAVSHIPTTSLYECVYQETEYADILDALANEKLPVCKYENCLYIYQMSDAQRIHFVCIDASLRIKHVGCLSSNVWYSGVTTIQDTLVFDDTPTLGSNNPVTSNGIRLALNNIDLSAYQEKITTINKLSSDLVDDTNNVHKFVTEDEKTKLAGIEANAQVNTVNQVNGKQGNVVLNKTDIGLGNVDNTSDLNKPLSTAMLDALNAKQNALTFDNTPAVGSSNPVTSEGIFTFVNSSIQTATAVFKGTYDVVFDLHLTDDATHEEIVQALDNIILDADNNDYCFVKIPASAYYEYSDYTSFTSVDDYVGYYVLYNGSYTAVMDSNKSSLNIVAGTTKAYTVNAARMERYKYDGTNWQYEYELNTSGFTAFQWAAINSGITQVLVAKLNTIEEGAQVNAPNTVIDANYKHIVVTSTSVSDGTNTFNQYVLPNDVVRDANYVHTDNNYTTADKNKLANIDLSTKVDKETTIAGVAINDGISASSLKNALTLYNIVGLSTGVVHIGKMYTAFNNHYAIEVGVDGDVKVYNEPANGYDVINKVYADAHYSNNVITTDIVNQEFFNSIY